MNAHTPDIGPTGDIPHAMTMTLGQLAQGAPWRLELLHDRRHHLLIWLTRGQGRVTMLGVRRGIGAHNALFVPAGTLMSLQTGPQALGHAVLLPSGLGLNWPKLPSHLRIMDSQTQGELTGLIDALARELRDRRKYQDDAALAHAMLISIWFRRQFDASAIEDSPNAARILVMKYAALVSRDFARGRSMADLAAELDVTPTHLTRVCKSVSGKSAADMLTERVLYDARDLLSRPGMSAQNIAKHLGFGSAAYFSRFILRHTGKTPGALRKMTKR